MTERQYPTDWEVVDKTHDNHQKADSRTHAEEMADTARDFGSEDVEILAPADGMVDDRPEPDGGTPEAVATEVVEPTDAPDTLPDRSVSDDPLTWMPSEFVDEIDGSQAINRRGFEVLSHFYDIGINSEVVVAPEETDHTYCRVTATATMPDGRECVSHGSAHVDRGDDAVLLLEMADTRARKRALSIASGAGAVAVSELKNEVGR